MAERPSGSGPSDDAKERFKAALDRKNASARRSESGARNDGTVHGPEAVASGRRAFRRKTG
jgi:hypothetical protein